MNSDCLVLLPKTENKKKRRKEKRWLEKNNRVEIQKVDGKLQIKNICSWCMKITRFGSKNVVKHLTCGKTSTLNVEDEVMMEGKTFKVQKVF